MCNFVWYIISCIPYRGFRVLLEGYGGESTGGERDKDCSMRFGHGARAENSTLSGKMHRKPL